MKTKKKINESYISKRIIFKRMLFIIPVFLLLYMGFTPPSDLKAQQTKKPFPTEVDIKVQSMEILRFAKPFTLSMGQKKISYNETMVMTLEVSQKEFDALPPSIEPFLYIGGQEYRIFEIQRTEGSDKLLLSIHVRNWEKLDDGAPIILTIAHGEPVKHPERLTKSMGEKVVKFHKSMMVDKRK